MYSQFTARIFGIQLIISVNAKKSEPRT